ncbi:MAG: glycosyltransferase, partial [Porticoccaceae bacterium]
GVSNGVIFTRKLLRQLGFESEIYSLHTYDKLETPVRPVAELSGDDCDLLLVHHSMGHDYAQKINRLSCAKVLVYHNITPHHYFPPQSHNYIYAQKGREQLAAWPTFYCGAIGMSALNSAELEACGYTDIATLPLLVDLDLLGGEERAPNWLNASNPFLLSVGRLVDNKRQHLLIEALWHLRKQGQLAELPLLVLVGGTTNEHYRAALEYRINELGLDGLVLLPGKCPDAELRWLYRHANAFWCASEHEGFCMPLVEAGYFELPVVAVATSNIPDTLGESGLLIEQADPAQLATVTAAVLNDTALRSALVAGAKRNLQRFKAQTLLRQLADYLQKLGFASPRPPEHRVD